MTTRPDAPARWSTTAMLRVVLVSFAAGGVSAALLGGLMLLSGCPMGG